MFALNFTFPRAGISFSKIQFSPRLWRKVFLKYIAQLNEDVCGFSVRGELKRKCQNPHRPWSEISEPKIYEPSILRKPRRVDVKNY